ncbi:MAG TPA: hypothetical protein VGK19_05155 [Capsulimonadaceae bacterium]
MTPTCPNCSATLTGAETLCPECGFSLLGVWPPPPDTVPAPAPKRTWRERRPYILGNVAGIAIILGSIFLTGFIDAWWLFLVGIGLSGIIGRLIQPRAPEFGRGMSISPLYFVLIVAVLILGALATCFVGLLFSRAHSP